MRLTCPNCNAQYEVDERVIPQNGRDVQCSACGNTWYQYPMEVALRMRAAELDEDDDDDDLPPPTSDGTSRPQAPRIDKTVLDVLREEAELEMSARNRPKSALETQGDLGLTRPTRSKAAPPKVYGEDDETPPPLPNVPPPLPPSETTDTAEPMRRRNLLPDIEELTSTLEPGTDARRSTEDHEDHEASSSQNSFRNGLSLVVLIAMFLIAIYLLSPLIATYVPALDGVLTTYVGLVDSLRATVSGQLRGLIGG
ncbi:zinc-ribbon domain-containing protein [Pararhodobacter sp.]|uniref:zinc-ribbon domain-containing protein n=1 Tax=Pararhodobacter sp. TaxID=2127056 RepID=UPI002AFE89F4|nr:zinc-ribbon domain-containing protein [Pararhodobacter sp.]